MADVILKLYVTGRTPSAERAIASVQALKSGANGAMEVQVIDVLDDPESALHDHVFATPTVIRVKPGPARRVFGNISSCEMLIVGLQLP
jgi:circadian clock protein KaiB